MTVAATPYKESYAGNGVTTVFSVPFYFLADTDLVVSDVNNTTGIITPLVLNVGYTVTGTGTPTGGTITVTTATATGHTLTIERSLAEDQPTHFVDGDPLPASGLEQALDRIVMLYQQSKTALDRAAKFAVGSPSSSDLPEPQEGYILGWVSGKLKNLGAATAQLSADLLSTAVGKGANLITYLAPFMGAVGTTQQKINDEIVNVKRFGAQGDGVTDDTAAIQAAFDYLHTYQNAANSFNTYLFTRGQIFFPEGNYKISAAIKVRAFCAIRGVGTGYLAGSVLHQITANTNIFEFYEANTGGTALGTEVEGLCFEFNRALLTTNTGIALYYPKTSDNSPFLTLSSNSHYIKNNHFGGYHSRGSFIKFTNSNDIEITGNVVDVCSAPIAIQIGDDASAAQCNDVRITQNNFYSCMKSIVLYGAVTTTIHGNTFSNGYIDYNGGAINIISNSSTPAGASTGITITGNTFWRQNTCLRVDPSATNVVLSGNSAYQCNNAPIILTGSGTIYRLTITENNFHLSAVNDAPNFQRVYANTVSPLYFDTVAVSLADSIIADNLTDANGINTVIAFTNDNTTVPFIGSGCVLRNNFIKNNTLPDGAIKKYVPCSAKELVIENTIGLIQALPIAATPVFTLTTLEVSDTLTFNLEYEVTCNASGVNVGVMSGEVQVSMAYVQNGGAPKSLVTAIARIGDDYNGAGGVGTWIPDVTLSVVTGPPGNISCAVAGTGYTSASTVTTIKVKAFNFRSGGAVAIKST